MRAASGAPDPRHPPVLPGQEGGACAARIGHISYRCIGPIHRYETWRYSILEAGDFVETSKHHIEPAAGRLGVLTVGLGAVASTFVAGVELIRRSIAEPIGSLTQMGTIRLGKRTEDRVPLIRDFVPLAGLDPLVFGGWDPIADTAHEAALKCGVLDRLAHIEPIAAELKEIEPMPAVFGQD